MGKVFAVMSGKGGVGKSTIAAALAEFFARQGLSTVLLDGDTGLRCADLMLGAQNQVLYDLNDVIEKKCKMNQALVQITDVSRLEMLAAPQLLKPSDMKARDMGRLITTLSDQRDVLILDAPAGIGRGLKNLLGAAAEPVIVATPDDIAVRDAERIGMLLQERDEPRPVIVFNRADKKLIRRGEMASPAALAQALDMPLAGVIPESRMVYRAALKHLRPLQCGDEQVTNAVATLGLRLLGREAVLPVLEPSPILRFFNRRGVSL